MKPGGAIAFYSTLSTILTVGISSAFAQSSPAFETNSIQAAPSPHFSSLFVTEGGTNVPLFSIEAYRAEFSHLSGELHKIDLRGPPVVTDGWTSNIAEAEWPFLSFAYLGYAAANFSGCDSARKPVYLQEMRWLIDALQTPRLSGFVTPHFGEPFGEPIATAVFVHGHFLNLALRYREASGDARYDTLIHRVADALARDYSGANGPVLPSYRDMWWLSDNFPAISALARYDRLFGRDTSVVRKLFLTEVKRRYLDPSTGLFATYVDVKNHRPLQGPRGISVMYGLHFLKDFDPDFAAAQYRAASHYLIKTLLGVSAVREFPEGVDDAPDIDSGPVILGLGPSASGFGIAAAAVNGDTNAAWALLKASALIGLPELHEGKLRYNAMPPVGQTVILFGKSELLKSEMAGAR